MNRVELGAELKKIGWTIARDEVGDHYSLIEIYGRIVQIIFGVRNIRGEQRLETLVSVSTKKFSSSCSYVAGENVSYSSLVVNWVGLGVSAPKLDESHVRLASDRAIAWAADQDLDQALLNLSKLPTSAPGAQPVQHLAALVLLGEIKKLKFYQKKFEAGDRLGFVPYITKDYIDRAVALAEQSLAEGKAD